MPKVVKLLKKSKGGLKHNQGPERPFSRREVEKAGSLEEAYRKRAAYGEGFAMDVVSRLDKAAGRRTKLTRA